MTDLPATDQPDPSTARPDVADDHGAALDRAADAIRDAQEAQGSVAAHDDITSRDDDRAGEYSEDPDGEGGHP
jgi:hypothetical protein